MSLSTLDTNIVAHLHQLDVNEKKTILEVLKTIIKLKTKDVDESISISQYNKELEDAMLAMDSGEFHTNEDALKLASKW